MQMLHIGLTLRTDLESVMFFNLRAMGYTYLESLGYGLSQVFRDTAKSKFWIWDILKNLLYDVLASPIHASFLYDRYHLKQTEQTHL